MFPPTTSQQNRIRTRLLRHRMTRHLDRLRAAEVSRSSSHTRRSIPRRPHPLRARRTRTYFENSLQNSLVSGFAQQATLGAINDDQRGSNAGRLMAAEGLPPLTGHARQQIPSISTCRYVPYAQLKWTKWQHDNMARKHRDANGPKSFLLSGFVFRDKKLRSAVRACPLPSEVSPRHLLGPFCRTEMKTLVSGFGAPLVFVCW